jgi:peptidoglycan/LPS O-acetylase OafA/YrhL
MGLLGLQEAYMIRYEAEETLLLVGTMVGFLVTTVLLRILHPTWTLQFAAVTYGLLLLATLVLPFVLHRDIVGRILLHCAAVLLGVCIAVFFLDQNHRWAYMAGALLFVVLMLAGLAYPDRRWHLHVRTSEQQTSTTEGPED